MMDDIDRRYEQMLFERDYPPAPPESVAAEPAAKGSRQRAQENAPGMDDAAKGLADMLAGALKGAVAQTLGLPGDIESLIRMLAGGEQKLPTTEDMQAKLPPVVPGQPGGITETLGEFLPVAPIGVVKGVAKTIRKGVTK